MSDIFISPEFYLCRDDWSGRLFPSNIDKIELAVARANAERYDQGDVSLNDVYHYIGLDPIPMGENFGWSDSFEVKFGSMMIEFPRRQPAVNFWFYTEPKHDIRVSQ